MIKSFFVLALLLFGLCSAFIKQEQQVQSTPPVLKTYLPAPIQKIALGYLKEIGAESQFIALQVFLGAVDTRPDVPAKQYASNLANNFETITNIYPNFIDFYYLCQSSLSYISPEYAIKTSEILMKGAKSNPDNVLLPSWAAFNYFFYAQDNKKASDIYLRLAQEENAPRWFGHLAAVLSVKDGDLQSGLLALQLMQRTATSESELKRHQRDIEIFQKAIQVSGAVQNYEERYSRKPEHLTDLIPEFLEKLPDTGAFALNWNGDIVKLVRAGGGEKALWEQ